MSTTSWWVVPVALAVLFVALFLQKYFEKKEGFEQKITEKRIQRDEKSDDTVDDNSDEGPLIAVLLGLGQALSTAEIEAAEREVACDVPAFGQDQPGSCDPPPTSE